MDQQTRQKCFAAAVGVASCPHILTCRQEMAATGKTMPLALPSPDYIGSNYSGLLIVAGNPGIAHAGIHHQNDATMFALQERIALGEQAAFDELMAFLPESMLHWPQMVNADGRQRMEYDINDIAYVELVKCATQPLGSNLRSLLQGTAVLHVAGRHTRAHYCSC